MKLKVQKLQELNAAVQTLEGRDEVHEIKGEKVVVKKPFEFTGKVRWNIAKNLACLSRELQGFEKVRDDIIRKVGNGESIDRNDAEKVAEFEKLMLEVLQTDNEVNGVLTLSEADLNLEVNPILNEAVKIFIETGLVA